MHVILRRSAHYRTTGQEKYCATMMGKIMEKIIDTILVLVAIWILVGTFTMAFAEARGRNKIGWFVYGAFLFPVAILNLFALKSRKIDPILSAIEVQNKILRELLARSTPPATLISEKDVAFIPKDVPIGLSVQPTVVPVLTEERFLAAAKEAGLVTGFSNDAPYRVMSDGQVEVLRPNRSIDVYSSLAHLERGHRVRTVPPLR